MADLNAAVTFHGPPAITVADGDDYELVSVVAGDRQWRRRTVEGPYMHGRALLGAVLEVGSLSIVVRCKGATYVAAMNRYNALLSAVTSMTYLVTVTVEGHTTTYSCEPADVSAPLEKFRAMAGMHEVTLTIPVEPS